MQLTSSAAPSLLGPFTVFIVALIAASAAAVTSITATSVLVPVPPASHLITHLMHEIAFLFLSTSPSMCSGCTCAMACTLLSFGAMACSRLLSFGSMACSRLLSFGSMACSSLLSFGAMACRSLLSFGAVACRLLSFGAVAGRLMIVIVMMKHFASHTFHFVSERVVLIVGLVACHGGGFLTDSGWGMLSGLVALK